MEVGSKKFSFSKIGEPRLKKSELTLEKEKSDVSEEQNDSEAEGVPNYIPDGPEEDTLPI